MDYKQWDRTKRPKTLLWTTSRHKTALATSKDDTESEVYPNSLHKDSKTHIKFDSKRAEKLKQEQVAKKTEENIKRLRFLIKSRKEAIRDLEEHCDQLQEKNLQMAKSIVEIDKNSVARANELIIQNQKLRKSTLLLKWWDERHIEMTKAEGAEEKSHAHSNGLQRQFQIVKGNMEKAQKELSILTSYKVTEFPVKALQIADLERKLERMRKIQQDEQDDIHRLFERDMVRFEEHLCQREEGTLYAIAEKHLSLVPPIVKPTAAQNYIRREEVNKLRKVITELEQTNEELMKSIKQLQASRPKARREIFPDVFLQSENFYKIIRNTQTFPEEK